MDKQEPVAKFKVGDPVQRAEPRSYLFPGIVIGANLKLDGRTWLYSVECIAPGVEGMVHEFTERALEARANHPADDGLVDVLVVAISDLAVMELDADEDDSRLSYFGDKVRALVEQTLTATTIRAQSDAEVERIVAWLRGQAAIYNEQNPNLSALPEWTLAQKWANAIERGEHRKDGV